MLTCRSCGSTFTGKFCSNCGAPAASLRCPRCDAEAAPNTAFCAYCGTPLGNAPFDRRGPAPSAPQQQNNAGKYLMGALGGAAAVIGGEILLHDVERGIERRVEHDSERREWGGEFPHHHHHHHHHHRRRCTCGHEFGLDIDFCPRCRRRWGSW